MAIRDAELGCYLWGPGVSALLNLFASLPSITVYYRLLPSITVGQATYHRVTNGAPTNGALREQFSELQLQLQQQQQLMIE